MNTCLTHIRRIPTSAYLIASTAVTIAACAIDKANGYPWFPSGMLRSTSELASVIMTWIGIFGLIALLPVSIFRPLNEFSLSGHCADRAGLFIITVMVNITVFGYMFFTFLQAF